jgi:hypothetical protein
VPAVAIAPATSSRYFDAAAIMARAESLTVEGACPSAQLIEPSAVALLAAVRDHFQKLIVGPQKQKPRQAGLDQSPHRRSRMSRKRVYARPPRSRRAARAPDVRPASRADIRATSLDQASYDLNVG